MADNDKFTTIPLSPVQIAKLGSAQREVAEANLDLTKAQKAAGAARGKLDDLLEVIFDAKGVPHTAEVNLEHGVIVVPKAPLADDIGPDGVSESAKADTKDESAGADAK